MTKLTWKYIFLVLFVLVILFFCFAYFSFFDMHFLPEGKEIDHVLSPDSKHMLIAYVCENALSAPAVRCEIVDMYSGKKKNIYWKYGEEYVDITWMDDFTVRINNVFLNINSDIYDWRHSE